MHRLLQNTVERAFPAVREDVPLNGIYILFEKGEHAHGNGRIVRVGSHRGAENLPARLVEHTTINKDRSIFRKNIGRALLNRDSDDFLSVWELDLTSRRNREAYAARIDREKQERVERRVTDYIVENFTFAVLPIEERATRLALEKAMIGTLAQCPHCRPSAGWLGAYSPKSEIRRSGLWLSQHLKARPVSKAELDEIGQRVTATSSGQRSGG